MVKIFICNILFVDRGNKTFYLWVIIVFEVGDLAAGNHATRGSV